MAPGQPQPRTGEQKQQNERRWREWVRGELSAGVTPLALTAQMVKRGWPRERAALLVASNRDASRPPHVAPAPPLTQTFQPAPRRANPYTRHMLIGAMIGLIGAAVAVGTMRLSSSRGGPFVVAWGATGFGAIQFVVAAIGYVRHRRG